MPSAVELFYTRRSRPSRPDPGTELHSSSDRHFHHQNSGRHHHQSHRHDSVGASPLRHGFPGPSSLSERLDQPDQGTGGGNGERLRSSSRPAMSPSERLPGAVLLARARLLERLRGVSVPGNRQSGRGSPDTNYREHNFGDEFSLVDVGDWVANNSMLAPSSPFTDFISQAERVQSLQEKSKKPPGLTQEAMDSLQVEVFSRTENDIDDKKSSGESWDCSICLESFADGDELVRLPCVHRFHSACLDPWVRTCGDCPYCRRGIL